MGLEKSGQKIHTGENYKKQQKRSSTPSSLELLKGYTKGVGGYELD